MVLTAASTALVAQTAGERAYSGGYATSGIPVTDDAYGDLSQTGPIAPVGVGAAATQPGAAAPRVPTARGRWTTEVTPYAQTSASYSDNIDLAPEGFEEDETILTATAGVDVTIQSDRLSGQIGYSASYDTFLNNTNEDGLRHNLDTGWTAAIVPPAGPDSNNWIGLARAPSTVVRRPDDTMMCSTPSRVYVDG